VNIYLLSRKGPVDYDEADGFVIAAQTSAQARGFAAADEGRATWTDAKRSTCKLIGTTPLSTAQVILRSFQAG
jgi:hypothetical protein